MSARSTSSASSRGLAYRAPEAPPSPTFAGLLSRSIFHPAQQTRAFHEEIALPRGSWPWRVWVGFFAIAVGVSLLFGASLGAAMPQWDLWRGALWLTLSAGLAWFVLGPALWLFTGLPIATIAHACLVTMVWGEMALAVGAAANFSQVRFGALESGVVHPAAPSIAAVAASNILMAAVLSLQLRRLGEPVWKTLLIWLLALDGSGAAFFWLFHRSLFG